MVMLGNLCSEYLQNPGRNIAMAQARAQAGFSFYKKKKSSAQVFFELALVWSETLNQPIGSLDIITPHEDITIISTPDQALSAWDP